MHDIVTFLLNAQLYNDYFAMFANPDPAEMPYYDKTVRKK
jgi:hypothetical protein